MSKINFNDHLDDMMERLMNEDLKPEELDAEIKRSKALCNIAAKKIEHNKVVVSAARLINEGEIKKESISGILEIPVSKSA